MAVVLKTLPTVTVAASGTEQPLASSPVDKAVKVYVTAPASNTGNIYVGDSSVAVTRGTEIIKGTTREFFSDGDLIDIQTMFVDVATNGDKAQISYLMRTGR